MDWDVENGDMSGVNCFMNRHTRYEAKNQNATDYTKKGMEILPMYLK